MNKENVLIVGAGGAGKELLGLLESNKLISGQYNCVGFIDDDEGKKGDKIRGLSVLGNLNDIPSNIKGQNIKTVFIAIPSGEGALMRKIISKCKEHEVKIKIVPRVYEIINNLVDVEKIRDIQVEDLLGRRIVRQNFLEAKKGMKDKTIIVFGAAGSIGSELCIQILGLYPKRLIAVDWWENGTFDLTERLTKLQENLEEKSSTILDFIIGNIQNKEKIDKILSKYNPDIIFNAAAYKHVPLMESNPSEAITNNVLGTKNLFELSLKHNIKSFVLISTDKAVNPTNIMGATKRITEKMMHYYSNLSTKTKFSAVRFGNVLNSNGSVIPTFKKQIKEGIVTVTHKDIVRYFMTINEAVCLIIQCWILSKGDEIFVLDMGEPMKILDLANLIIRLSGKEPGKDVKIKFIGLRPGEKLSEESMTKIEKVTHTKNEKIYILSKDEEFNHNKFIKKVEEMIGDCGKQEVDKIKEKLKEIVPTYKKQDISK